MRKRCTSLLLAVLVSGIISAQKTGTGPANNQYAATASNASFTKFKFDGELNTAGVQKLLQSRIENLQQPNVTLKLNYINESPGGFHYSFTQLFAGIPVYQSEIKINIDRNNIVHSVFDNSYNTKGWNVQAPADITNAVIAIDPKSGAPVVCSLSIEKNSLETLTANGNLIFQRDMNSYYQWHDSTVTGKVFNPDPLTSSHHNYTDIASITPTDSFPDTIYYDNNNGADEPWMDGQQKTVSFKASFNDSVFTLASPYVVLTNYDTFPPDVPPATSLTPQFNFNRSQSGFQDVNAFYHISHHRDYVAGLGFNCADSLVLIDTHAIYEDNSYFSPSSYPRRIYYGVGGVPDAEDADVVVHEYCHSLSYNCAPGSNVGLERNSLDEAFCDYNAAAYSKVLSTFNDEWVYNWDGHNQYWPGRIVNSTNVYPANLGSNIYTNGEMWSAVLFSLNGDIGRGVTDSIIYQTHYSYAQNITMAHAAILLIDADSMLFNGAHYCNIYERLVEHGFVNPASNGCVAPNSINAVENDNFRFTQTGHSFTLYNTNATTIKIQILSITGQQVAPAVTIQSPVYNYQNANLATGIYLVNVVSDSGTATFKWMNTSR